MNVIKLKNAEEIGKAVAEIIINQVNAKPDSVLGFATGASPVPTYKCIIDAFEKGQVSLKDITTFNLDEYCGLNRENVNSYYYFMKDNLFGKTDVDCSKVNFLSGLSGDIEAECKAYQDAIEKAGGIDIQLLGVGTNGHIGFNEPSDSFSDGPFKVKLDGGSGAVEYTLRHDDVLAISQVLELAKVLKAIEETKGMSEEAKRALDFLQASQERSKAAREKEAAEK